MFKIFGIIYLILFSFSSIKIDIIQIKFEISNRAYNETITINKDEIAIFEFNRTNNTNTAKTIKLSNRAWHNFICLISNFEKSYPTIIKENNRKRDYVPEMRIEILFNNKTIQNYTCDFNLKNNEINKLISFAHSGTY